MYKSQRKTFNSAFNFNKNSIKIAIASLFIPSLLISTQLQAADIEKEFYLTSEITRLSNPSLVETNKSPVTVLRIAPEFNMTVASELNKYYLKSLLSVFRNSNEDVLPDRENPSINVGWERTLQSGLFGIQASYVEDVALTQLLTTAGTAVGNNAENQIKTKTIGANLEHEFNSRFSIKNNLNYSDISFSENSDTLVGFTTFEAVSRLIYRNSETFATYGQLGRLQFDPDSDVSKTKISRARIGVLLNPSDSIKIDANAGVYKATGASSFNGSEAEILATYERDRINYNFSASKLVAATGLNQVQKNITFVLGARYLLSDINSIGAEFNHTLNKTDQNFNTNISNADVRTRTLAAFYEHALKDWKFRASAKYLQLDNGITRNGNEIGITAIYGPLTF